jgi:hypothetical protein
MKPEHEPRCGYYPLDSETLNHYELKLAAYQGMGGRDSDGIIAYRVFPDKKVVVFSGLNDFGTSTMNASDKILKSLRQEDHSIDPYKFRFFDVLTVRGYDYISKGKFHIWEIRFHENGEETLIPRIKSIELPEAFLPVLAILSNPQK